MYDPSTDVPKLPVRCRGLPPMVRRRLAFRRVACPCAPAGDAAIGAQGAEMCAAGRHLGKCATRRAQLSVIEILRARLIEARVDGLPAGQGAIDLLHAAEKEGPVD